MRAFRFIFSFSCPLFAWALLGACLEGCSLTSSEMRIERSPEKMDFHAAFLSEKVPESNAPRPNIVLILADDLSKMDVSLYGGKHVPTPNIDRIGQEGVVFSEGYITSPICSPSRAGMLTGRYQQRFGYEFQPHDRYPKNGLERFVYDKFFDTKEWNLSKQNAYPDFESIVQQGLPPEEFTLAELLKKHGYATGIVGKWHLGTEAHCWPNARGFDHQYGFYEAYTLYQPDTNDAEIVNQRHDDFSDPWIWKKGRTGNCALRCNHVVIEDSVYLTERLADEAVDFIGKHKQEPFFLYVPFSAPHTPFQVPRSYFDRFAHVQDRNKRVYYGMIAALDDAVGRILASLEAQGLAENTMVWFLSDNGGASYTRAADNAPLKGGKFTNFEGGLNVPFLLRWPAKVPAGLTYAQPVVSMDIFQTSAALAEVVLPSDRPYDGVNLMPYLSGEKTEAPHEALFWRSHYAWAIRKGDWKLVADEMSGSRVLYNLGSDKSESHNRYVEQPQVVAELQAAFDAWDAETIPPLWPRVMDFRFETEDGVFYFPL